MQQQQQQQKSRKDYVFRKQSVETPKAAKQREKQVGLFPQPLAMGFA